TPEEVIPKRLQEKQKSERETAVRISQEIGNLMKEIETLVEEKTKESLDVSRLTREGGPLLYEGISLTMNSKLLNGSQRVVMDGVISDHECQELQRLTNVAATSGDGYRGQTSPHTPNEKFYGVTVFKALKFHVAGEASQSWWKAKRSKSHLTWMAAGKERTSAAGARRQSSSAECPPVLQRDGEGAAHHGVLLPPGYAPLLFLLSSGVPHCHRRGPGREEG
ncbi:P3H1 isoform 9, partial [Pan troglodytes]